MLTTLPNSTYPIPGLGLYNNTTVMTMKEITNTSTTIRFGCIGMKTTKSGSLTAKPSIIMATPCITLGIINDAYNQGEPGAYYPGHEDYYKGK